MQIIRSKSYLFIYSESDSIKAEVWKIQSMCCRKLMVSRVNEIFIWNPVDGAMRRSTTNANRLYEKCIYLYKKDVVSPYTSKTYNSPLEIFSKKFDFV